MYKLIIKPFAEADAAEAAIWYQNLREGLGEEFLMELEVAFDAIRRNPYHFQLIDKNIRRTLTKRFPFAIFYVVDSDTVFILAILHIRRSPLLWKKRKK